MLKGNLNFQSYAMEPMQREGGYAVVYCGSKDVERLYHAPSKRQAKKMMIALAESLDVGESLSNEGYPKCSDRVVVAFHLLNERRKMAEGSKDTVEKPDREDLLKKVRYEVRREREDLYGVYEIGLNVRNVKGWRDHLITHKPTAQEAEILADLLQQSFIRGVDKGIRNKVSEESLAFLHHLVDAERFGTLDAIEAQLFSREEGAS